MTKLEEYIKQGIVKKEKNWYYYISGDKKTTLGNSATKAAEKLKLLEPEGNQSGPSKAETSQVEQSQKTEKALGKEITSTESESFADFLGKVQKISAKETGKNIAFFINGIKSTLIDHPEVLKCPLYFRWRKKENMVDNGDGYTNRGYVVISKKIMKEANFTIDVSRDDTPKEDYYTVGDSILCCTDKKIRTKRKADQQVKGILRAKKSKEQRNEFAKQQAKTGDVDKVVDSFANVNTGDSKTMKSNFKGSEDYGKMIEEAKKSAGESDDF